MDTKTDNRRKVSNEESLVNEKMKYVDRWTKIVDSGEYRILCTFLAVSKDEETFGVLSLPDEFVQKFGGTLPFRVGIKCRNTMWCVKYDLDRRKIYGLNKFMRYYRLTLFSLVQLYYYGEGAFVVRLLRDTTLECNYPLYSANDLIISKDWEIENRDDYVLDSGTIQYERFKTSMTFNGCSNNAGYASVLFDESELDPISGKMLLSTEWEDLYQCWTNRSVVSFRFLARSWNIRIKKRFGICYLGKGLKDFLTAVGLRKGDYMVGFRDNNSSANDLRVCIYEGDDHKEDVKSADSKMAVWSKSFFKIVCDGALEKGFLMVPFLVQELYGWKLREVEKLSICGVEWSFSYKPFPGYIYKLRKVFRQFHVKEKETMVFTMNESNILSARIYKTDGMEIDYLARSSAPCEYSTDCWIWDTGVNTFSADENQQLHDDEMQIELHNVAEQVFTACLSAGNVDKKTHGLFIPSSIRPSCGKWKRTQKIKLCTDRGVWDIGITVTGVKARFSAGWNKFIRDNEYKAGQHLNFRLLELQEFIEFHITRE